MHFLFAILIGGSQLTFLLHQFLIFCFQLINIQALYVYARLFKHTSGAVIKNDLAFVSAEICVRVLGFLVSDMIRTVVLVLLGIFDDFRKVFHAVFQFHNALFGGLSHFGFYSNFMLQIGERTSFIIALCGDFQILDCCPLLQSGTVLEFLVRGVNEPACRVVFFRNNCLSFPFLFDAFPDTFLCVFFP